MKADLVEQAIRDGASGIQHLPEAQPDDTCPSAQNSASLAIRHVRRHEGSPTGHAAVRWNETTISVRVFGFSFCQDA